MQAFIELLLGWMLLWKGGDYLVEGADRFARGQGMPASLAGVFILGFGTSAPELATSALAAFRGEGGVAIGNVVGSNIANVGLILGCAILLGARAVDGFLRRYEMPIAIAASLLAAGLLLDGDLGQFDGLVLIGAFAAYTLFAARTARRRPPPMPHEGAAPRPAADLLLAFAGIVGVLAGAYLFLEGALTVAGWLGVSSTVIGLSLVALGTSLPELATTVAAARSGRTELAVGNVVGSNIFNVLLVLGVAGAIRPEAADDRIVRLDVPIMCGFAVLCWLLPTLFGGYRRAHGILLIALYVGYVALLAASGLAGLS